MTANVEKAVIYSRVSTARQDNERQLIDLKKYAVYKGLEIVAEFTETISGTKAAEERSEYQRLTKYIASNGIKHLLVSEISRLGRVSHQTLTTINTLTEQGVCIHILKESIQTLDQDGNKTPGAILLLNIFSAVAEVELDTLKHRISSGLYKARLNHAGQRNPPLGFQNINKKIAIQEEEASIVKQIFSLYLTGKGSQQIAQHLNKEGIKPRSTKHWSDTVVLEIIKNPIYNCERRVSGELIRIPEELRIVDTDTYRAAQHIRQNKKNKQNTNRMYLNLLEGILKCSCGQSLWMHRRKNLTDNAYKCLSRRYAYKSGETTCNEIGINIDLLNSLVEYHLRTHTNSEKFISKKKTLIREADRLEQAHKKERAKVERANELYTDGMMSRQQYLEKYESLTTRLETLKIELEEKYEEIEAESALEFSRRFFEPDGKLKRQLMNKHQSREPILTPPDKERDRRTQFNYKELETSVVDAEALQKLVKQQIKEIRVKTLTDEARDKYKLDERDYVHRVTIIGYSEQSTIYHTASRNKLIYKDDEIVKEKLETIFI